MTQGIEIDEKRHATPNFQTYLSLRSLILLKPSASGRKSRIGKLAALHPGHSTPCAFTALARRGPAGAQRTPMDPRGVSSWGTGGCPALRFTGTQPSPSSQRPLHRRLPGVWVPSSSRYPGPMASGPDPGLCPVPLRPPAGPLSPLFLPSGAPGLCSGLCPLRTSLGHGAGSPSPQPLRLSSLPVSSAGSGTIRKPPFSLSCAPGQGQ